jgi:hypothetical protein
VKKKTKMLKEVWFAGVNLTAFSPEIIVSTILGVIVGILFVKVVGGMGLLKTLIILATAILLALAFMFQVLGGT